MCGIAGVFHKSRDQAKQLLAVMLRELSHRGPERSSFVDISDWRQGGSLVLGHTLLSISSRGPDGAQPKLDSGRGRALIFNGEIFNHQALTKGKSTDADTLSLFSALELEPLQHVLPRIEGFYALAYADRNAGVVSLARDRFGVKPLYFSVMASGIVFASELRALASILSERQVDLSVLHKTLADRWTNGCSTPLSGVYRLMPGEVIEISLGDLSISSFISTTPRDLFSAEYRQELKQLTRAEIADRVETELKDSLQARLRAGRKVGILCSGGLDSSLLAALAKECSTEVQLYSLAVPDEPEVNEAEYAKLAAKSTNLDITVVDVRSDIWRRHFVSASSSFGYPLVHESSVGLSMLGEACNALDNRVLISGEGADELFGGYPSRHLAERAGYFGAQPPAFTPSSDSSIAHLLGAPPESSGEDKSYLRSVRNAWSHVYRGSDARSGNLEAALASDLELFLPHGLNRLDKNLMAWAVEAREPFLDSRLARTALSLPLCYKLLPRPKGILLDIARRRLPRTLVERPKNGFSFDPARYLGEWREEFLLKGRLRDLFGRTRKEVSDALPLVRGRTLMRVLSAEIWCRRSLDLETIESIEKNLWQ